jgi:hypothetical protein
MKANKPVAVFSLAVLLITGCATMEGLPQGSVLTDVYEGSFNGVFIWGTIKIRIYDTPGGSKLVIGQLDQDASAGTSIFRGEMMGPRMVAQFTIATGTVTGEKSPDGESMSGTYRYETSDLGEHGTWNARKK